MRPLHVKLRSALKVLPVILLLLGAIAVADNPDDWHAPDRASKKKNPVPSDQKTIAVGKDIYTHQCVSCHGNAGKGDGPAAKDLTPKPHDLGAPNVVAQTDGALFWKVTEGRKPMPSFEKLISEDERWEVIDYVRTFAPPATEPSPKP